MKKYFILIITTFILTGCSATANITIDKDKISEDIKIISNSTSEYSKVKNWNGFPLPLYYDQDLNDPFSDHRTKESGVKYYDVTFDDNNMTTKVSGNFNYKEHVKSSIVKNCFKLYNITKDGTIMNFSTSEGLICDFSNFNVVVKTPYKVIDSNAKEIREDENIYIWKINNSNKNNIYLQMQIDFSQKYNEEKNSQDNYKDVNNNEKQKITNQNQNSYIIVLLVIVTILLIMIVAIIILAIKKKKASEL